MANCKLPGEILSISGAVGPLMYKTFHKPDGSTVTRVYPNPYFRDKRFGPRTQRTTAVSEREKLQRQRFARIAKQVAIRIANGDTRPKSEIWAELKRETENE